jgi:hypothetical protein
MTRSQQTIEKEHWNQMMLLRAGGDRTHLSGKDRPFFNEK